MDAFMQFLQTLVGLAIQIFDIILALIIAILSFLLVIAREILTALHVL